MLPSYIYILSTINQHYLCRERIMTIRKSNMVSAFECQEAWCKLQEHLGWAPGSLGGWERLGAARATVPAPESRAGLAAGRIGSKWRHSHHEHSVSGRHLTVAACHWAEPRPSALSCLSNGRGEMCLCAMVVGDDFASQPETQGYVGSPAGGAS